MIPRSDKELLGPDNLHVPKITEVLAKVNFYSCFSSYYDQKILLLFLFKSGQKLLYNIIPKGRKNKIHNYMQIILHSTCMCTALIIGHCFVDCSQERQSCNRGNCWQDGCSVEAIWEATTTMIFATEHQLRVIASQTADRSIFIFSVSWYIAGWWLIFSWYWDKSSPTPYKERQEHYLLNPTNMYSCIYIYI